METFFVTKVSSVFPTVILCEVGFLADEWYGVALWHE